MQFYLINIRPLHYRNWRKLRVILPC